MINIKIRAVMMSERRVWGVVIREGDTGIFNCIGKVIY